MTTRKKPNRSELELRKYFGGRRKGKRRPVEAPVSLACDAACLSAKTINISQTGVLFHLTGEQFDGENTFLYYSRVVQQHFQGGSTADFGDGLKRSIEIVRVTFGGLGGAFAPLLACRFATPLSKEECSRIGKSLLVPA